MRRHLSQPGSSTCPRCLCTKRSSSWASKVQISRATKRPATPLPILMPISIPSLAGSQREARRLSVSWPRLCRIAISRGTMTRSTFSTEPLNSWLPAFLTTTTCPSGCNRQTHSRALTVARTMCRQGRASRSCLSPEMGARPDPPTDGGSLDRHAQAPLHTKTHWALLRGTHWLQASSTGCSCHPAHRNRSCWKESNLREQ